MILSLTCGMLRALVFHPSWCEVTVVRFDAVVWARFGMVETVGIREVIWLVMLEFAKDRVIGVDTPGQQVSLRVWYGTTCLLIREVMGSVPLGWVRIWRSYSPRLTWCKRGCGTATNQETLASYGTATTLVKPVIRHIVKLCNDK
jgi:hypothetical protein